MAKTTTTTIGRIILIAASIFLLLGFAVLLFFYIGYTTYDYERWSPDKSEMLSDEEILEIFKKGYSMTDEDYNMLYKQTGLTKIGVERVLESKDYQSLLRYRDSYFADYEIEDDVFTLFCNARYVDEYVSMVPLKEGDIIVSSATNFSMWDVGHAVLIVDGESEKGLEAVNINYGSEICSIYEMHFRPDFMVLRLKDDDGVASQVAEYAKENLCDIPYDPTVGVLTPKYRENLTRTQCAHIIWYAFKQFGIDIDSNGGMVVSPKNIANSDKLEVVQIFGFDPETMWK